MAVQTFRHAAKLFPSGHRLPDRLPATLCSAALEARNHARRASGRRVSLQGRFGSPTAIRKQHPEWQGPSVLVARSAPVRPGRAMQGHASRAKPEFPRFRARSHYVSFRIDDPTSARRVVRIRDANRLGALRRKDLPRRIRRSLPPLNRLRGVHLVRKAQRVEVRLLFEENPPAVRTGAPERLVGLDAGVRSPSTPSDGGGVERQRKTPVRSAVRRPQRDPSRGRRDSKSRDRKKAALRLERERHAEPGRQELHRHPDPIGMCRTFTAVEALRIRNPARLGKNQRDPSRANDLPRWRKFFDIPDCGARSAGSPFAEAPAAGRPQDCARYLTRGPKALSERVHRSGMRGIALDRDENAARTPLSRGLRMFAGAVAAGRTAERALAASAAC